MTLIEIMYELIQGAVGVKGRTGMHIPSLVIAR
jgi:hypothetical protein